MAIARQHTVIDGQIGIYHCISRCVRRAFLCGEDGYSGRNFDHRKEWIKSRLEHLAGHFAIEVWAYSIMSNHLHIVIRTRPDVVKSLSDDEVARQWLAIFPKAKADGDLPLPAEDRDVKALAKNKEGVEEIRRRLSSVSWFMRCLNEPIARQANKEDNCTGRFWEGRFKCQALLDESAILACMAYVDLNPVRAGLASIPEESEFTSIYDRIMARQADNAGILPISEAESTGSDDKVLTPPISTEPWLCPLWDVSPESRLGIIDLTLDEYLALVDWTGRQIREGKRGTIPGHLSPILERLQVNPDNWLETVEGFGGMFYRVVGRLKSLLSAASEFGTCWLRGLTSSRHAFGPA